MQVLFVNVFTLASGPQSNILQLECLNQFAIDRDPISVCAIAMERGNAIALRDLLISALAAS